MDMVDGALERTDVKVFNRTANKSWGSKLPVSSGTSYVENLMKKLSKNFDQILHVAFSEQMRSY